MAYSSPNFLRDYLLDPRMHPITTPQEVLLVLFFQEKNKKPLLQSNFSVLRLALAIDTAVDAVFAVGELKYV